MAEELTIKVPKEKELSIKVPKAKNERISDPFKQGIAGVVDFATEIPGILGLAGAGIQAGANYFLDNTDRTFKEQFQEAVSSGVDTSLLRASATAREFTNKTLGIAEPQSTEDILARNAALFLPIPGIRLAKGASKLAKFGVIASDIALPTVKNVRRTKTPFADKLVRQFGVGGTAANKINMVTRGGIQGSIGLGIDQGVRAALDDPNYPLLFSDTALGGGTVPFPTDGSAVSDITGGSGADELSIVVPKELSISIPKELSVSIPDQTSDVAIQDRLDIDAQMQKAEDWDDVKTFAVIVGALLTGSYLTKRLTGVGKMSAPPKPNPNFSSSKYLYETSLDRGKVADHVFEEMKVDPITIESIHANTHTDVNGIAREAVNEGKYGQGFDNSKWPAWSSTVLDADEAVLRQFGIDGRPFKKGKGIPRKAELFNDAMQAGSELSAVRKGGRTPSLWRKDITDSQLDETFAAARNDEDIKALMDKHAQNYRADIEYEVHRGFETRANADEILGIFGDIKAKEVGTYMPFYGKTPVDISRMLARKFLGINTKKGDELRTVAEFQARGGGTSPKLMKAGEAMKRHRLHNTAYVNDQLYRHDILSKMAGFVVRGGKIQRLILSKGKFINSPKAMHHSNTGRGTYLVGIGDDIKTDPNNVRMKIVKDDPLVNLADQSVNDLRNHFGRKLETVQHQGKLYAYVVPDQSVRAGINLSPTLGRVLEFNNHWRGIFTKFTVGAYSLFPPISHMFSAQQVASATAGREGVIQGAKSFGRSLGGSRDIFVDQMAGILANYLARSIATQSGFGKGALRLQATLHNRYSNSLLAKVRSETGRTLTGIGSADTTLQSMLDEFGGIFSNFYGAKQMGLVKNVWKALNNAANEGPAFGVIQREIGRVVQEGRHPNIAQIRKAVEEGKTRAGDMARRGTSPFAVGFNASIPFSSAMLQSWNALGSAAKYDWKAFALGVGALIGAPTIMELGMNAALSKAFPKGFEDASGKFWTYDDYYWNGFTTQQRVDNMIVFVPGLPPWEAIVLPISPEWSLFRAVVIESADAIFNLSRTGSMGVADDERDQIGRDHFLGALHRVFDLPIPPLGAAVLSLMGLDIRAGFNVNIGEDPEAPETTYSPLAVIPIGTGERITGRLGRTKDVNGSIDRKVAAAIKDIWGAGGTAYVAFHEAINAGTTNQGGSLSRGLEQGFDSILDSARRQARYTQPLFGKVFRPSSHDEIATSLHGKRQALESLSKDMKVLMGGEGFIRVDGKDVPVDTVIPTQDPIRQELAQGANVVKGNIAMLDKTIASLRAEIVKMHLATNIGGHKERQDKIDGKELEIQAYKAMQLGALHTFEDIWSEELTKKYQRDITVNLSGGFGKTIAARPNLSSISPGLPK